MSVMLSLQKVFCSLSNNGTKYWNFANTIIFKKVAKVRYKRLEVLTILNFWDNKEKPSENNL
jgi:hypothetical protein